MFRHTSINKLVVYLEIGFLNFVLFVLLLSALDSNYRIAPSVDRQADDTQAVQTENAVKNDNAAGQEKFRQKVGIFKIQKREAWIGDLDAMLKRQKIRILIPSSRTFLTYALLKRYEKFLNDVVTAGNVRVNIVFLPTPQEQILDDLLAGIGDIAAGDLTVTSEQEKLVDFSSPVRTDINKIVVTGLDTPQLKNIFSLSGLEVTVRKSGEYYDSLLELNNALVSIGKKPAIINIADEFLSDENLLKMTDAGLLPMTVVDSHVGKFWSGIYTNLQLHHTVRLRAARETAWAVRPDNSLLKESINYFIKSTGREKLNNDNLPQAYYFKKRERIRNNLTVSAIQRYNRVVSLFKKYGDKYNFPYLLLTALAYQASELDQSRQGEDGAVGIMQISPSMAKMEHVKNNDINILENNIHAGAKYLRFLADHYFSNPKLSELDQNLMAVAAYKAGPERVTKLRTNAAHTGFDPYIWFNHVEVSASVSNDNDNINDIAQYVRNVYMYLQAYKYITKKTGSRK